MSLYQENRSKSTSRLMQDPEEVERTSQLHSLEKKIGAFSA